MTLSSPRRRTRRAPLRTVGLRIRKLRRAHGMGQLALIQPEFTKKYLRAIEKCSLIPSMKVIELFASRLGIPITQLLRTSVPHHMGSGITNEKDLGAFEEDLNYQLNYIKTLVKEHKLDEAMTCVNWAEAYVASASALASKISRKLVYRLPLLKGMIYNESYKPGLAIPELKKALDLLGEDDEEKAAIAHNLLGSAYYLMERPELAVQEYLIALRAVNSGAMRDLSIRASILGNVANAYAVLGDSKQALAMYKEVLPLFQDLTDLEHKGHAYNGLGKTYWDLGDFDNAALNYSRAREIYEENSSMLRVADVDLCLSDMLMSIGRDDNVESLLKEASEILATPEHKGNDMYQSMLHRMLAIWSMKHGKLEEAESYIRTSLDHGLAASQEAEKACAAVSHGYEGTDKKLMPESACYPIRTYVEALQVAAKISEKQGLLPAADERFRDALHWAEKTGAKDTIHTVNMVYAESMEQRGSDLDAMEFYKAAAQANHALNRKGSGPAVLVG